MAQKPLANVDRAWFRMEHPANLMMISGVMIFEAPMDIERLKATIEQRLLRFDRFRQRVVRPRLPFYRVRWEDYRHFDLNDHVHHITLPAPGDKQALQDVASALMSTQLDFSKPLWEVHLAQPYGDGCALIARLHHSIADGIALVHVLLSLTDTDPDAPWPMPVLRKRSKGKGNPLERLSRPARSALAATSQITDTAVKQGRETLAQPKRALEVPRQGVRATTDLARLVLRWPDPKTPFKGDIGIPKRAAWSDPIPLDDVKAVGRGIGATVNDVLLAAVTGALRRYMQRRGDAVNNVNFRAVVPVNLRSLDQEPTLGNKFGLVFLSLPVGVAEPLDRLQELKRRMDALKGTSEPILVLGILYTIGGAPYPIQDVVVKIFATKGTAVMTNVPGPKETLYLAGSPLDTLMFWVPQSGRLGLGVSILSYAGKVFVGVATDRGLVPDPEQIVADFEAEFNTLLKLSKQMALIAEEPKVEAAAEIAKRPKERPAAQPDRCQALTKASRQCKNRPLPDSDYCRVHQGYAKAAT
jgi:diacylglycerol O-acyltransferase